MLKLASSVPEFFAFSGKDPVKRGEAFGCNCAKCNREISAPFEFQGQLIWCLYCGMEAGHVPIVEHPHSHKWSFGVTREECVEDIKALAEGNFEEMAAERARRGGRLIDPFELFI